MSVHAFLATAAELPGLLDGGTPPARGASLNGVTPVNLASLVEIVTGGAVSSEDATAALEEPVLTAGARGPSIHRLPETAVEALGTADAPERARWLQEWTGRAASAEGGPGRALETLADLARRRAEGQDLYLRVADGA